MRSPLVRLLGSGTAMLVIGLTGGPAMGQSFTLEGTVSQLNKDTACFSQPVADLCGFGPGDVLAGVVGPPPSSNQVTTFSEMVGDCDFTVSLFNDANKNVDYEDLSLLSQTCGTPGAEAALIRNGVNWNVYCGSQVTDQADLRPPPGGNNQADQVAICFTTAFCEAPSDQDLADACAALGDPDILITDNIEGDGDVSICACPGTTFAECRGQECFDDPNTPGADPAGPLNAINGLRVGQQSCKTYCKTTTGGTGSSYDKCVQTCQSFQ